MNKTVKIFSILMIIVMLCTLSTRVFATDGGTDDKAGTSVFDTSLIENIKDNAQGQPTGASELTTLAGKVLSIIRTVAVIGAVILISVLGIKYMMGSAEEKSGYQKSFVPLVVGIVVVAAATQIATMIFSAFNG